MAQQKKMKKSRDSRAVKKYYANNLLVHLRDKNRGKEGFTAPKNNMKNKTEEETTAEKQKEKN